MEFKRRYHLFIGILLLIIFLFGCSSINPEQGTGKIIGIVIDEKNQSKFYEGATVQITDLGGEPGNMRGYIVKEIETDSEGRFEVELERGTYLVEAYYKKVSHCNREPVYADVFENQTMEVILRLTSDCLS